MADEIKLLHRQRGAIKHKLTNFVSFLNPLKKMHAEREALNDVQIADLKFRVENLRLVHTDFEQIQTKIENICDESNLTEEFDQRSNFFDTISNVLAQAQVILDSCISVHSQIKVESPNMLSHIQGVKLPTINLPKFQGNYDSWLEFKDLFESLINSNQSISKIQKFHYLKASLELDAAKIIQSLEFTSENYDVAWELLCSRYNNSKLLVHNHIKSIFELEPITKESSVALRRLVDNLYKHLRALEVLKQPTIHWDALLVFLISSKLDRSTAREWERFKMSCNSLKLDDIKDFLYKRADFLETFELNHGSKSVKNNNYGTNKHYSLISTNHKCNFCKKQHLIYSCPDFLQLTVPERIEKVKDLKLCENCLCTGHSVNKCKLRSCKICKNRHSSLLHQVKETAVVPDSSVVMSSHDKQSSVLLPTVRLYVYDANGSMHLVKAVLDSGSQSNFISAKMCNKLGLNKEPTHVSIAGINDSGSTFNHKCQITIKSIYNDYSVKLTCLVIPQIAGNLPAYEIDTVDWKIPSTIQLADPDFSKPSEVDLLLGASHFWEYLERGQLQLSKHLPVLQNTKFGWIASGLVPKNASQLHCYFSQNISCDLRQFWEIEEHECPTQLSKDDADCERFFKETITRQDDGRFIVRIPLKYPSSQLGDSKQSAIKRLLQLEHRFISDPILKEEYSRFMQEYLDLGHMTKIKETSSNDYFLPHHGVVRKSSLTTKLRVVFNGSAQSSSGWSVNDLQHVGPPVHTQLFSILLQFRQHPIAVCADIEKMYRQILVHPDDRHLQNIVWRFDSDLEIDTYSLNTITYGTASAPYLAIRCLKQLAHEVENEYPVISNIINNHFYVDDLIISFTSEEDAIATCKTLKMILQQACFPLRKWISNSSNVSQSFKDENDPTSVISFSHDKQIKTLGVVWNNISDTFSYQISANSSISPITKRIILSEISKVFDPLGLVSPCIILAKIIIQQLWTLHLDWDDTVPIDLYEKWINFREQLHVLNSIQIPRHVTCSNPVSVEIHGFCDSSNSAYGSSIYIRSIDNFGNIHVNLLCAKTRVAPLKILTIPRLELCGALMLARLVKIVKKSLNIEAQYFLWCDSQIVLHWIRTPPHVLNVFVGNRVSEIQQLTNIELWHYINTKENPADLLSRGVQPKVLLSSLLWWHGPSWLKQPFPKWPQQPSEFTPKEDPELRKHCLLTTEAKNLSFPFERFSKFNRIKRVMAYCLRFINNSKMPKCERLSGDLTVSELNEGVKRLVRIAQAKDFEMEITILRNKNSLDLKNRLSSLTPFLDQDGLLRVGGRLKNSTLNFDNKHPLLLSGKHSLTRLIFEHVHLSLLHAGPQLLLSTVRQNYWPTSGMNTAKRVTRSCVTCFKSKPHAINPIMANLPRERVTETPAFSIVGVDYAGPILIKDRRGRGSKVSKGYICLFVCFVSKAVHLELSSDLSTQSFLASLKRFISRRGKPTQIWSDNGTNFKGAQKELYDLFQFFKAHEHDIVSHCAMESFTWKFIPPNSPHFGGLWESGIKTVKFHLKRVLQETKLTYEELYTVLTQIESVLNSRPLYPLSSDPNDLTPLTPSHLLIGRPLTTLPEMNLQPVPINRLSRVQFLQSLYQSFWKRWSTEYLSILQQRSKWKHPGQRLQIGALVLIKQENLPPSQWILGRITEVHPDSEGVVRVASVRTSKGIYKRAVVKLCPLPITEEQPERKPD